MTPDETSKLITGFAQYGVLGLVTVTLGLIFLKQNQKREERFQVIADEDRKWRNDMGEKVMVLCESLVKSNQAMVETNTEVTKTNTRLIGMLDKK